jgi:selenocysteine lyase/cysteine desulfurase
MLDEMQLDRPLSRRAFMGGALSLSAALVAGCASGDSANGQRLYTGERVRRAPDPIRYESWAEVRGLFELDPEVAHLSAFILAPHPRPVREAIERHRRGLDRDPSGYMGSYWHDEEQRGADAAAHHLGTSPDLIALTDSTSMGLGLLIGSMQLAPGDEVLLTAHEHYMAHESVRYATDRAGAEMRAIELYPPSAPEEATVKGIVSAIEEAITDSTRLIVVTWVQTASGIRLPLHEIAHVVEKANKGRSEETRALLLVDGAHALGAGEVTIDKMGCDAFVASGHKWLAGPRGTGIAWATEEAWMRMTPIIPSWDGSLFGAWIDGEVGSAQPGPAFTPGGYHSFEHRWAFADAFDLQSRIGVKRIGERVEALSARLRDGLAGADNVVVHAPAEQQLRSGIVCFDVDGVDPETVVHRLSDDHGVSASVAPYPVAFARLGTCWLNTEQEIDAAIRAVHAIA